MGVPRSGPASLDRSGQLRRGQLWSHSLSFDQRRVCWPRTAMASALRWPTSTTSRLLRVTPA